MAGPSIEEQRDRIRKQNKIEEEERIRLRKEDRAQYKKEHREKTRVVFDKDYRSEGWRKKRKKILYRDGYACAKCGAKKNLVVHHKKYAYGRMLYQVPDSWLITWCNKCHVAHHEEFKERAYEVVYPKQKPKKKIGKKRRGGYKSRSKYFKQMKNMGR